MSCKWTLQEIEKLHVHVFLIRNMYIRKMRRLKLGKSLERFKKHGQAEFQIITFKNCFYWCITYQASKKIELISIICHTKPVVKFYNKNHHNVDGVLYKFKVKVQ